MIISALDALRWEPAVLLGVSETLAAVALENVLALELGLNGDDAPAETFYCEHIFVAAGRPQVHKEERHRLLGGAADGVLNLATTYNVPRCGECFLNFVNFRGKVESLDGYPLGSLILRLECLVANPIRVKIFLQLGEASLILHVDSDTSIPAGLVIESEVFDGQSDVSDESLDVRDIRDEDRRCLYGLHGGSWDGVRIAEGLLLCFVSVHRVDESGKSIGVPGGQSGWASAGGDFWSGPCV